MKNLKILDCTFRDGGYYNAWDFDHQLVKDYMKAMAALPVDTVELGFRYLPGSSKQFLGACAYTTDSFLKSIDNRNGIKIAVMVNGIDLINHKEGIKAAVNSIFSPADESPVELVRIATHFDKLIEILPAINQLKELGYKATINLMQISELSYDEIKELAKLTSKFPVDVLYFADSLGSMVQNDVSMTVEALRTYWKGELGFHAHNNMEMALFNVIRAIEHDVTWIDGTVLGMGRGPGNARTEYLVLELESIYGIELNHTPLHKLISKYFKPMQDQYKWGSNPFYYMAGKYGIHPTYIQEMLNDTRYDEEDLIAVIHHLKKVGGKKFKPDTLEAARNFFIGKPRGTWNPSEVIKGRDVLILGAGPGIERYRQALELFISKNKPYVIALNTQSGIDVSLIDARAACHPIRLLADCEDHLRLPQPLITPASMLPPNIKTIFHDKELLDYGIAVKENTFCFKANYCILPTSIVIAYTLAIAASSRVNNIFLAGFDGYGHDDPRNIEMNNLLYDFQLLENVPEITAITPTQYKVPTQSIYAM